jgi:hypothetical protein
LQYVRTPVLSRYRRPSIPVLKTFPAAAAALTLALALPGVAQAQAKPRFGELSARLGALAEPGVRSASPGEQAEALGLPRRGPASLLRAGDRVLVQIRVSRGAAAQVDELRAAGARVTHLSSSYQVISAYVDPEDLSSVARVPRVEGVMEVLAPLVGGAAGPSARSALNTCAGSATSEADSQLNAAALRNAMELDGAGMKVGALSDSFDNSGDGSAAADVGSGDLPGPGNPCGRSTPVEVVAEAPSSQSDEGRAMLQLVHDLAPGADLAFATAFSTQEEMADNIRTLRERGANVIVDDITYFAEPMFQDGPISVAVDDVTGRGATYFSSAANTNIIVGGNDVASWETPAYRDGGTCPAPVTGTSCENFDPDTGEVDLTRSITVGANRTLRVVLQWAEPWNGVTTDIDAVLLNDAETQVLEVADDDNPGVTQRPAEVLVFQNIGPARPVKLVIRRFSGAGVPRMKMVLFQNGPSDTFPTEYTTSAGGDIVGPTIYGHNGAANASSVAAVNSSGPDDLAPYSARGPVTHRFGPVVDNSPAPALATPRVLAKPDIAATDCTSNTFFGGGNVFCGTSAAAPHAAAVAALQLQGNPGLTPAQVRAAQAASGRPVGAFGTSAIGAGLVDALPAVQSVALPPVLTVTAPPPATNDATPSIPFAANRPVSLACTLDGAAVAPCASPFTPTLVDGPHTFVVRGVDAAGRTGTSAPASFVVDTVTPDTTVTSGPGFARSRRPLFGFRASESSARFECSFDRRAFAPCSGPGATARPAARLSEGGHGFRVRAIDAATNTDASPAERRFTVDTVRPRVTLRSRPAKRSTTRRARFTFKASERVSKFECRIDGRKFKRCRSGVRVKVRPGLHRFRVRAVDRAGNRSAIRSYRWRQIA